MRIAAVLRSAVVGALALTMALPAGASASSSAQTVPPETVNWLAAIGFLVDGAGGLHVWATGDFEDRFGLQAHSGPRWPGQDLARGIDVSNGWERLPSGELLAGGLIVDAHGGLHRFSYTLTGPLPFPFDSGLLPQPWGPAYWPNRDLARGVALLPQPSQGGFVVDAYGGLHPFRLGTGPLPTVTAGTGPWWPGRDLARGVTVNYDGSGGYVLDAYGGLHPFGVNGMPAPPPVRWSEFWQPGWDIARGVDTISWSPGGAGPAGLPSYLSGYVLDAWGAVHRLSVEGGGLPRLQTAGPYWPGRDLARGLAIVW